MRSRSLIVAGFLLFPITTQAQICDCSELPGDEPCRTFDAEFVAFYSQATGLSEWPRDFWKMDFDEQALRWDLIVDDVAVSYSTIVPFDSNFILSFLPSGVTGTNSFLFDGQIFYPEYVPSTRQPSAGHNAVEVFQIHGGRLTSECDHIALSCAPTSVGTEIYYGANPRSGFSSPRNGGAVVLTDGEPWLNQPVFGYLGPRSGYDVSYCGVYSSCIPGDNTDIFTVNAQFPILSTNGQMRITGTQNGNGSTYIAYLTEQYPGSSSSTLSYIQGPADLIGTNPSSWTAPSVLTDHIDTPTYSSPKKYDLDSEENVAFIVRQENSTSPTNPNSVLLQRIDQPLPPQVIYTCENSIINEVAVGVAGPPRSYSTYVAFTSSTGQYGDSIMVSVNGSEPGVLFTPAAGQSIHVESLDILKDSSGTPYLIFWLIDAVANQLTGYAVNLPSGRFAP